MICANIRCLQEGTPGPGVSRRRRLQHASSKAANVTVVTTAQQLQEAIAAGKEHIEIRQHLDLTTLHIVESDGKTPIDEDDAILGAVPPSVKSIRVSNPAPTYSQPMSNSQPMRSSQPMSNSQPMINPAP